MAKTRAQLNREVRQHALREQLAKGKHVDHVIDNLVKMSKLDPDEESFSNRLIQLKTINEQKLQLIKKYLPDPKQVELSGEVEHRNVVKIVDLSGLVEEAETIADDRV